MGWYDIIKNIQVKLEKKENGKQISLKKQVQCSMCKLCTEKLNEKSLYGQLIFK